MLAQLTGFERVLGDLAGALDQEGAAAALRAAGVVADDARVTHTFQNRTGDLQASINPAAVRGGLLHGDLAFDVAAEMEYASFVNAGTSRARAYPFLAPALEHQDGAVAQVFDQALAEAVRREGLNT